ncbi:hypothetical protein LINGRAHAP2_LOCUS31920 [Linum grandiflorum]
MRELESSREGEVKGRHREHKRGGDHGWPRERRKRGRRRESERDKGEDRQRRREEGGGVASACGGDVKAENDEVKFRMASGVKLRRRCRKSSVPTCWGDRRKIVEVAGDTSSLPAARVLPEKKGDRSENSKSLVTNLQLPKHK